MLFVTFNFIIAFFFQPNFTNIRFWRVVLTAIDAFGRIFTLTGMMGMAIRSTVFAYRSGVFRTVVFVMSEPLAVKTAQRIRYIHVNRNDTIKYFRYIYSVKSQE